MRRKATITEREALEKMRVGLPQKLRAYAAHNLDYIWHLGSAAAVQIEDLVELARRISAAGYAAIDAQRRADHWAKFGTNSDRAKRAEYRLEVCLGELERLDRQLADLMAALTPPVPVKGRHLASCLFMDGRWFCAADCEHHVIVDVEAKKKKRTKASA